MIDEFLNVLDTTAMLTTTKHAGKQATTATPPQCIRALADLEFASVNQQLEGFPGEITEEAAAHQPDMEEIAASAKRFGAQAPTEANRKRPPVFPKAKS